MDLRRRLDEVLQVRPREEVAEVHELAVLLVLDIDDAPAVLAPADGLAVDEDVGLGADNGEGDFLPDVLVYGDFLFVVLVCVEGVQTDVVVNELFPDLQASLEIVLDAEVK